MPKKEYGQEIWEMDGKKITAIPTFRISEPCRSPYVDLTKIVIDVCYSDIFGEVKWYADSSPWYRSNEYYSLNITLSFWGDMSPNWGWAYEGTVSAGDRCEVMLGMFRKVMKTMGAIELEFGHASTMDEWVMRMAKALNVKKYVPAPGWSRNREARPIQFLRGHIHELHEKYAYVKPIEISAPEAVNYGTPTQ